MKIIKVYKSLSAFLFYLALIVIFSGINFSDNRTGGWFLQTLAVPDDVQDIFFIDSLRGWVVTKGYAGTQDTGYIMHTTNGGYNWIVQKRETQFFLAVQFLDTNNGYVVGGNTVANIQKTTNGGINWQDISSNFGNTYGIYDLAFVNKDTGWVCLEDFFDGGVYKTINGGLSWTLQKFDQYAYKLCFINKDTGWYISNEDQKLWRTTNGGNNWSIQYTTSYPAIEIFFFNKYKGWMYAGYVMYTTDGGFSWTNGQGASGGYDIKFINESIGYGGVGGLPPKIDKTTDGGLHWGYQVTPHTSQNLIAVLQNDTSNAWAGNFMHTTDGGGPIIYTGIKKGEHFLPAVELHQNYPNPFNPSTKIKFAVYRSSYVELVVYDIRGREIETLLDNRLFNFPCIYEVDFDANENNLSSGVYFYRIKTETEDHKEIFIDTKKLMFVK